MAGAEVLVGRRILVVEDDYFIAHDLSQGLTAVGAEVIGPFSQIDEALEALRYRDRAVAAAVLDFNVGGTMVHPVAEALRDAGVPFVFATGYDDRAIPAQFQAVPRVRKPVRMQQLLAALAQAVAPPA